MRYAIESNNIRKSYNQRVNGKISSIEVVRGVSIAVKPGEIFGFLGPNGAGKTTILRMLTTLLPIDIGDATVAGFDVSKQPKEVRRNIGYISQLGGADLSATGFENLNLAGHLYGMESKSIKKQAEDLINTFDLSQILHRKVKTYSGGQRRRLEIALGLIHQPKVLFLDEPTTGLDPQNRNNLWDQIRKLRDNGTTIFITTHYLEEADELADRLSIIDYGQIVAEGTPSNLKKQIAGDVIVINTKNNLTHNHRMKGLLDQQPFIRELRSQECTLHIYVEDGAESMPLVMNLMKSMDIEIEKASLAQPSLDDVFLKQTGRSLRDLEINKEGK